MKTINGKLSLPIGVSMQERKQRAELIPERPAIIYDSWTEGETRMALLAEQLQILSAYAPEDRELKRAENMVIDLLYRGLHRAQLPSGIVSGRLAKVVAEIRRARKLTRPAAGNISRRKDIGKGIPDPFIPVAEIGAFNSLPPVSEWYLTYNNGQISHNPYMKILNDHLEKSAHHILYEFVANPNTQPSTVATKTVNHRAAMATIHTTTKLSNDNLRMWVRNGVIRHNALAGAGPLQPEETIDYLKKEMQEQAKQSGVSGIGEIVAILTVVAKIIYAIGTAAGSAAAMVAAMKQQNYNSAQLFNQLQGIGTGVWGPELEDWYLQQQQQEQAEAQEKMLPLLLIGGGALLFLQE